MEQKSTSKCVDKISIDPKSTNLDAYEVDSNDIIKNKVTGNTLRFVKQIGQGGFGVVNLYATYDNKQNIIDAIVIKKIATSSNDNEQSIVGFIKHHNIRCDILNARVLGVFGTHIYILYPLYDGSLDDIRVQLIKLEHTEKLKIINKILEQLVCLYRHGLLYTDLKLQNTLFKCNGGNIDVCLSDLGGISIAGYIYTGTTYITFANSKYKTRPSNNITSVWNAIIFIMSFFVPDIYIEMLEHKNIGQLKEGPTHYHYYFFIRSLIVKFVQVGFLSKILLKYLIDIYIDMSNQVNIQMLYNDISTSSADAPQQVGKDLRLGGGENKEDTTHTYSIGKDVTIRGGENKEDIYSINYDKLQTFFAKDTTVDMLEQSFLSVANIIANSTMFDPNVFYTGAMIALQAMCIFNDFNDTNGMVQYLITCINMASISYYHTFMITQKTYEDLSKRILYDNRIVKMIVIPEGYNITKEFKLNLISLVIKPTNCISYTIGDIYNIANLPVIENVQLPGIAITLNDRSSFPTEPKVEWIDNIIKGLSIIPKEEEDLDRVIKGLPMISDYGDLNYNTVCILSTLSTNNHFPVKSYMLADSMEYICKYSGSLINYQIAGQYMEQYMKYMKQMVKGRVQDEDQDEDQVQDQGFNVTVTDISVIKKCIANIVEYFPLSHESLISYLGSKTWWFSGRSILFTSTFLFADHKFKYTTTDRIVHYCCSDEQRLPILKIVLPYGSLYNTRTNKYINEYINVVDNNSVTPIYVACTSGLKKDNTKVIQYLFTEGTNLHVQQNYPLINTMLEKNAPPTMIKMLLKEGAHVDYQFYSIMVAVKHVDVNNLKDILDLLITYKANNDGPFRFETTPTPIDILVIRNADVALYYILDRMTPTMLLMYLYKTAKETSNSKTDDIKKIKSNTCVKIIGRYKNNEILNVKLSDVTILSQLLQLPGKTAYTIVVLKSLLESGASVDFKIPIANMLYPPIIYVFMNDKTYYMKLITYLLDYGANINETITTTDGVDTHMNLLNYALDNYTPDSVVMLEFILKYKGKDKVDFKDNTLYFSMYAHKKFRTDILKQVLQRTVAETDVDKTIYDIRNNKVWKPIDYAREKDKNGYVDEYAVKLITKKLSKQTLDILISDFVPE